jgi:hypothetical protein
MSTIPKAAQSTFEELVDGVDPQLVEIARRLRAMILKVDPKAVETVRLGDHAATYGVGPKKMTEGYAYIMPLRGYVNLGFYQGARLPDPARLLEGTGKGLRHVKVRTPAAAGAAALRQLVRASLALRKRTRMI